MPLSPELVERQLRLRQRVRAGGLLAEAHVLAAVMEVEELVAHAAVGHESTPVPSAPAAAPAFVGTASGEEAASVASWRV
jgi:hypothetical protein